MAKQVDPNKMSRAELEEYVNNLPEERPPKMSNAGWLAAFGVMAGIAGFMKLSAQDHSTSTWLMLGGAVACLLGAGFIVYRVITHKPRD
jgi:hypothetical protein